MCFECGARRFRVAAGNVLVIFRKKVGWDQISRCRFGVEIRVSGWQFRSKMSENNIFWTWCAFGLAKVSVCVENIFIRWQRETRRCFAAILML